MKKLITIPRVIGVLLIVIAALAYGTQGMLRTALLAIAGLVFLLSPRDSSHKHWQHFLASFRLKKEFALIMLYDIVFWALLAVLTLVLANVMRGQVETLKGVQVSQGLQLANLPLYNDLLHGFFTNAAIALIIFWACAIIAYSLSRGLIWLTLLEKQSQQPFFIRFGLLNIVWCTLWLAFLIFVATAVVQPTAAYALLVLFILYAHLTTVLHYQYTKLRAFGKSIKDAFGIGLGSLGSFAQPYCYIFIAYVILSQIERIVHGTAALVAAFIIFLIFMAWYRTYLRNIIRSVA